ncbi:MAG: ABC-F family ATP-binding cassette domain-containing protein [Ignavibacterium sp.]|nr:ABC-F family ATP-binding cassette domain-containing protein [Ignavibacterium sp.]MDW8374226.1 ABC-F family ATP-binding cassette domain-containing protein [Ignavibacteriales bacterium]
MIDLINISLQFNGKYLFKDVNYKISSGDRISLVGANGTGKSSLLKIIKGELLPEEGIVQRQKNISIGYLPQELIYHSEKTLLDEALSALTDVIELQKKEKDIQRKLEENNLDEETRDDLIHQLGEIHHKLIDMDSYSAESKVEKILLGLGFKQDEFDRATHTFSGGWQMRIALAKILIAQNDILLLDEPTNHLDLDSLNWLINFLKSYQGALVVVSHDKNFINQVTNKTLEIYLGKVYSFKGDYDSYIKYKSERDLQLIHQYELQQKRIQETQRFIERFRYKATKARQVQSRIKQLEKIELVEIPEKKDDIKIKFPEPIQSGRIPIQLKNISKSYDRKLVLDNINLTIERGEKIAFVGPNGAGKTTLAKIIAGEIDYDFGERIVGYNTFISYYAQDVADNLDPELDIIDSVSGINEEKTLGELRTLLGSFLFSGDDVFKKVGVLSGGEKSRVALCKILLTKANLIVLDEPTNHLDIDSKLILQKALIDFSGTLVIVSHDVDFLRPIANKIVDVRNKNIKIYFGNIDYYLEKHQSQVEENISNTNNSRKNDSSITRKEQKRLEAELRNKRYQATKDLYKEIEQLENQISKLENEQSELHNKMNDNKIYSDPNTIKDISIRLKEIEKDLENLYQVWEEKNNKVNEILEKIS